ncbi:MAG: hypothetical protein GY802_03165 [Gammaproteobacteria bacterium]|nr:hypothetical protein [Gammaproteobacteria bacterium]
MQQLKELRAGLRQQWSTTRVMKALGFNVTTANSYEGLFGMLMFDRFDYFPRGVNEIYAEFDQRAEELPELAKRIETGLLAMIKDGNLDKLFWEFHKDSIERANLAGRQILRQHNPLLTPQTPLFQENLWFDPLTEN